MLDKTIAFLEAVITTIGRAAALLVLAIIAVMIAEMVSRGVFGHSLPWSGDVSRWLMVALIFLGGPWALVSGKFVRVDALFGRLSPKTQAILDSTVSTVMFALLAGTLLWLGWDFAKRSLLIWETSATGRWRGPVWVAKALLPLGTALLICAWALHLLRLWRDVIHPPEDEING